MAKRARGGVEERGEKLLGLLERERDTEQVGFAAVGICFVAGLNDGGLLQ